MNVRYVASIAFGILFFAGVAGAAEKDSERTLSAFEQDSFVALDRDSDGALTEEELRDAPPAYEEQFSQADVDGDQQLDRAEFDLAQLFVESPTPGV